MRSIVLPDNDSQEVYRLCINSITDVELRNRLNRVTNKIVAAARDYEKKAKNKLFYAIPPNNCRNNENALGAVTKQELKDVYSLHMVGKSKPGRDIYDSLLSQAGRCPFCALGHASTLDHYLPKAKYPQLSVLPMNLVPSCKDCNTGKSSAIAVKAEDQCLHPYFDHQIFINEQWLYAEVIPSTPEFVRYFVEAPAHWDDVSKGRVQSHFKDFKLASRYADEAADELAARKFYIDVYKEQCGSGALVELLQLEAKSYAKQYVNSWRTALYQALASKNWDCEEDSISEDDDLYIRPLEGCPRCSGRGQLMNTTCEVCNGLGSGDKQVFDSLDVQFDAPVSCPSCTTGAVDCSLCYGKGVIPWERAKELSSRNPKS